MIEAFSHILWVQHAFDGIRVCVCVLIFNAVVKLFKKAAIDKLTLGIFLVVALGSCFTPISPIIFVILAGAIGVVVKVLGGKK